MKSKAMDLSPLGLPGEAEDMDNKFETPELSPKREGKQEVLTQPKMNFLRSINQRLLQIYHHSFIMIGWLGYWK